MLDQAAQKQAVQRRKILYKYAGLSVRHRNLFVCCFNAQATAIGPWHALHLCFGSPDCT